MDPKLIQIWEDLAYPYGGRQIDGVRRKALKTFLQRWVQIHQLPRGNTIIQEEGCPPFIAEFPDGRVANVLLAVLHPTPEQPPEPQDPLSR